MMGAHAFGYKLGLSRMSHAGPVVFVVDDDVSVRESLELLIRFEGWELQKAISGYTTHESALDLPVFANTQEMNVLVERIDAWLDVVDPFRLMVRPWFARMRDRVFARTWHFVADAERVASPGRVLPCTLLERCLDEPIVLSRDGGGALHALSNVCTHRGNLVVQQEGR